MLHRNDPLIHSFTCLSLVTAALLVAVQIRGFVTKPPPPPAFASSFVAYPDQPVLSTIAAPSPQATFAHPGLSLNVQTALNPNSLARRSRLIVDLSDRQVYLFQDGVQVINYPTAVGQAGWETPTGQFRVVDMLIDPAWQHPFTGEIFSAGADNPLGSRWIGFWTDGTHQIGLHGTNQDDLIGQAVSHGCIRMRDADVQALYAQVAIGTEVLIRP
ncbi:L,D-transpeptidase [Phormidium tenue FACHB-886]|nr:L,D-transpeptidase [Phormidium tenue FACHB-886]